MVANGFDPVLRWDGQTAQMETAGVGAPVATPSLSGSGAGPIVGTYYAYLRYVDRLDNYSNLSPISAAFTASGTTGTITGATDATPIVVTSPGHGLTTGTTVSISGVGGNDAANNTWIITVVDANTFSLDMSSGDGTYNGGGTWLSGIETVTFSNLETPTDQKITRRQLLRNTDGQATTFYVDVDTTDLTSSSISSTNDDTFLAAQPAVPILDVNGAPLANIYYQPPNHKGALQHHLDRMFAAVQYDYKQGCCQVTFGSPIVVGVGTEWMVTLAERYLYVVSASNSYVIASVDPIGQTITLTTPYLDPTDQFAVYAIRPAPTENRLVYYSSAGLPEAWSPEQAIELQADDDDVTGLMSKGSFLFILERRHIYRFTYQTDPATDGAVFLSANRGCINQLCWVDVQGSAYMLDEQGIHAFDSGQDVQPVGAPIQQIFRPGQQVEYKINWQAYEYFHAIHYAPQETIRWFVALSGEDYPRHALAFNYRLGRWWIEEFNVPVGAACFGNVNGIPNVFLGSEGGNVLCYWQSYLDGPSAAMGTVQGTVTSSGLLSFTDASATFAAAGLIGTPVAIIAGTGKGQVRMVVAVSGQEVSINQPWSVMPDTTTVYQIGAIEWLYRCAWFPYVQSEEHNERRFQIVFNTTVQPATMDMRLLEDFSDAPLTWATNVPSNQGDGIEVDAGSGNLIVDFTRKNGVVQKRFGCERELYTTGPRYSQVELAGFTNQDQIAIYQITFDGVSRPGS